MSEDARRTTALIGERPQTEEQHGLAELRDEVRKHREAIVRLIDELIEELRKAIPEG